MNPVKLALIGCGGMSKSFYERFPLSEGRMEVRAVVDVDEAQARKAAQTLNAPHVTRDYREILDEVDAVLVVLPHHLHHPVTMECLEAGKHVLVEKPMANTEAHCLEMIEAAKKHDRVLMVGYVMRYHPLVLALKDAIDQKKAGDIFQLSIWTEQFTRREEGHWLRSAEQLGGGQLFSHGCHYIDLMLWMLGRPVNGAHVGTNLGTPWMEREGSSNVTMKFESGAMGYHFGTWGARGSRLRASMHAHGTKGMLEADVVHGRLILHQNLHQDILDPDEGPSLAQMMDARHQTVLFEGETTKHTHREVDHLLDCIETGQSPLTDGPTSLQSLRVIWRLYEAEHSGRMADLTGLGLE